MRSGSSERARSVSVNCGYASHAFHAVLFPIPRKDEVVSQPVKMWNRGRAKHFRGQSWLVTAWTGIIWKFLPDPTAIHNSANPRLAKSPRAMTTMSLWTVRMNTLRRYRCAPSRR